MNSRQLAAIREVEAAMKELAASGLVLAGIDSDLLAFPKRQYYKMPKNRWGVLPAPAEIINELDYRTVDSPYIDGGGR